MRKGRDAGSGAAGGPGGNLATSGEGLRGEERGSRSSGPGTKRPRSTKPIHEGSRAPRRPPLCRPNNGPLERPALTALRQSDARWSRDRTLVSEQRTTTAGKQQPPPTSTKQDRRSRLPCQRAFGSPASLSGGSTLSPAPPLHRDDVEGIKEARASLPRRPTPPPFSVHFGGNGIPGRLLQSIVRSRRRRCQRCHVRFRSDPISLVSGCGIFGGPGRVARRPRTAAAFDGAVAVFDDDGGPAEGTTARMGSSSRLRTASGPLSCDTVLFERSIPAAVAGRDGPDGPSDADACARRIFEREPRSSSRTRPFERHVAFHRLGSRTAAGPR